jgi:hypothetical protein
VTSHEQPCTRTKPTMTQRSTTSFTSPSIPRVFTTPYRGNRNQRTSMRWYADGTMLPCQKAIGPQTVVFGRLVMKPNGLGLSSAALILACSSSGLATQFLLASISRLRLHVHGEGPS